MKVKNRLKIILESQGFKDFSPTDELLIRLGMSRRRFFQVMNNSSFANDLVTPETHALTDWLIEKGYISDQRELFYPPQVSIGSLNLQPVKP